MTTFLYTHPACLDHDPGRHHPESPARLRAVLAALDDPEFARLERREAPEAALDDLVAGSPAGGTSSAFSRAVPKSGHVGIDADTVLSPASGEAALRAAGAVVAAVDAVVAKEADNAFCAVRPPGHHAEPRTGDGVLPVQQCRDRRAAGARGARARPRGRRRFRRPSRQRHAGGLRERRQPVLRLDASISAISGHRRGERDRGRQHRQRAAPPDVRLEPVSPRR